ncbi:MAG: hypothetical protein QM796_09670 [Chthoniobacteraceae bacterium]
MFEIHRQTPLISTEADSIKIKILGLGGAGCNALDRILLDGLEYAEAVAVNTDVQALTASVAPRKIQIGRTTTHGLGTGGDPEMGLASAEEGVSELSSEARRGRAGFPVRGTWRRDRLRSGADDCLAGARAWGAGDRLCHAAICL